MRNLGPDELATPRMIHPAPPRKPLSEPLMTDLPILPQTLGVIYTCGLCAGAVNRTVQVPVRGEDEDIVAWMNHVLTPALVRDHQRVSPGCRPTTLQMVKIPIPPGQDATIGGPTAH